MERLRNCLSRWPSAIFSLITIIVILWLTLAPKPFGDETPQLFPGADKLVHALMFGFLTAMLLLDWQRKNRWHPTRLIRIILCGSASALLGITIEFIQDSMGMGRGFEIGDIIADIIGAYSIGILWKLLQHFWLPIRLE